MIIWRERAPLVFATLLACSLAGWMLLGLRHISHDDLYFDLLTRNPNISWEEAAWGVAVTVRRFSHLLNIPLTLVGLRLADIPVVGDLAILSQLVSIVGGTGLLLRRWLGGTAACGWAILVCGGFALHWYYMPPLAYPLLGVGSLSFLVLSLLCLVQFTDGAGRGWLWLSVVLSTFGIIWPEYNFVLFPLAVGTVILLLRHETRARMRLALAFVIPWSAAGAAYFLFRHVIPPGPDEARLTVSLDLVAWAQTLGILLGKGLLPIAMLIGVDFNLPATPGMPGIPHRIDFGVLWGVMRGDIPGFALVLFAWTAGFLLVLRRLRPHRWGFWLLLTIGAVLMVLPPAIVALSTEYQRIVRLGYIQGHVSTVDVQAGFLTLVFACCAILALRWRRLFLQVGLALGLAALCTLTLAYNLLNRDGMAANDQKWKAFAILADALPNGARINAPAFWQSASVSNVPDSLPLRMTNTNYWIERANIWQGKRIVVANPGVKPAAGDVRASYGVRPDGIPILLVRDANGAYLLAAQQRTVNQALTGGAKWHCGRICRLDLPVAPGAASEAQLLALPRSHSLGLFSWLLLPRSDAFGRQ